MLLHRLRHVRAAERQRRNLAWAIVVGVMVEAIVTIAYGAAGAVDARRARTGSPATRRVPRHVRRVARPPCCRREELAGLHRAAGRGRGRLDRGAAPRFRAGTIFAPARSGLIGSWRVRTSKVVTLVLVAAAGHPPLLDPDYVKDAHQRHQVEVGRHRRDWHSSRLGQLRVGHLARDRPDRDRAPARRRGLLRALATCCPRSARALGARRSGDSRTTRYLRFLGEMARVRAARCSCSLLWKCLGARRAPA